MTNRAGWARGRANLQSAYDVVVIGGGITGIQVATELRRRGLSVVVVEKDDIGAGTSSATTKYIHGGLRYLEQGDVGTVAESIRERRRLARAAPLLVVPRRFLLPVWDWTRPSPAVVGLGLGAYELLAVGRNRGLPTESRCGRARWVSARETLRRAPWLKPEGLRGAFAYYDMLNLHPERLLITLAQTAVDEGVCLLTHFRVERILTAQDGDRSVVTGVSVAGQISGEDFEIPARFVVNAAGPWADQALGDLAGRAGLRVKRAKGVHLLTRPLGGSDAVFTRTRDGHHVVVSPWEDMSLIGPTDTPMDETADAVRVNAADIDLIVRAVSDISVKVPGPEDLKGACVGVRPLIHDGQVDSYSTSRRHEIHRHAAAGIHGLASVTGGKWTTGAAVGRDTARYVSRHFPQATGPAPARTLHGYVDDDDRRLLVRTLAERGVVAPHTAEYLVRLYGSHADEVVDLVALDPRLAQRVDDSANGSGDILAQAVYAVLSEGAQDLDDILRRRMVIGTRGFVTRREAHLIAQAVAELLGWGAADVDTEVQRQINRKVQFEETVERWSSGRGVHGPAASHANRETR